MKRKKFCLSNFLIATINIKHLICLLITSCALVTTASTQHQQQQQQQQRQQNPFYHQHHLSRKIVRQIPFDTISSSSSAFIHRSHVVPESSDNIETINENNNSNNYDTIRQADELSSSSVTGIPAPAAASTSDQDESQSGLVPESTANAGTLDQGGNVAEATHNNAGASNSEVAIGDDRPNEGLESENHDEAADNSQEVAERDVYIDHHNSQLQAMHDLFERRQLSHNHPLQSSQELSPMTIGLDAVTGVGSPFNMPPFSVPNQEGPPPLPLLKPPMANADNVDQGLGPTLPFGLNHLPHLLGFQNHPFDGPQRGDQSAHTNHHAALPAADQETGPSQKVWPKIFRFTDGRINLSDFEKQKKIRLSSKNQHQNDNHIESAPIMFDGRQLKRKSFLILHGGIFSK